MIGKAIQTGLNGRYAHVPVLLAWLWAINLVFFPTWWFGVLEPGRRVLSLVVVLLWIVISSLGLYGWLSPANAGSSNKWLAPKPTTRQSRWLYLCLIVLGVLGLIPATYPLTSYGDEEHHAGTFSTIGQGVAEILEKALPGSPVLWLIVGGIVLASVLIGWWYSVNSRHRTLVLVATWCVWIITILIAIPVLLVGMEKLVSTALAHHENPIVLSVLVRFPPLAKLLWLPVGVCCWQSVFALRLPALVCWLLSGLVLHRVICLRERSFMALLPALYLLTLPGMFFFAHLVYLTTPMLLAWCIALYFYECYCISKQREYLIWTALTLSIGLLIRRETGYLALGILAHWSWIQWRAKKSMKEMLIDGVGLVWFGLSLILVWGYVAPRRPFSLNWENLLDPSRLLTIANDFPYHLGPLPFLVLLFAIMALLWKRGRSNYSLSLLGLGALTIGISYILYTSDWLIPDERMIGLIAYSREWQTEHRFLVSWTPFIAILLAEGVSHLPWLIWRYVVGIGLALVLLAQATVWSPPMLLPEFTSLLLQPGSERPHWPDAEVITYVSEELATPQTRIFLHKRLAAGHYLNSLPTQGIWVRERWLFETSEELAHQCESQGVSIVILPVDEIGRAVLSDEDFKVRQVFEYLGQPAIVVAEYVGPKNENP